MQSGEAGELAQGPSPYGVDLSSRDSKAYVVTPKHFREGDHLRGG